MTQGDPLKLVLKFMGPLLIGNIFQQLYSISDVIIVGRTIGINALAAVGASLPVFALMLFITLGLTSGFTVLTGQYYGGEKYDLMRRSVAVSIILSTIVTIVLDIAVFAGIDLILAMMRVPEVIYSDVKSYILIITAGLWAMIAYNFLSGVLRALGDSKTPLYFLVFSTIINVILALFFILYLGWGVPGSALAIILSEGISGILCLGYIRKSYPILHLKRGDWHWDSEFALKHLKMGVPMAGQFSLIGIGLILIQSVMNSFGPEAIAGFTAAGRVEQMALQPMVSFGIAVSVFTAQNYGAGKYERIKKAVSSLSKLAFLMAFLAAFMIFAFSEDVISIFLKTNSPEVMHYAESYLHISIFFYFFLNQIFVYRGAVQGMGNSIIPFISACVELCMRIGAAVFLAEIMGYRGVCFASPIAWVAGATVLFICYKYLINKASKKNIIQE